LSTAIETKITEIKKRRKESERLDK